MDTWPGVVFFPSQYCFVLYGAFQLGDALTETKRQPKIDKLHRYNSMRKNSMKKIIASMSKKNNSEYSITE